MYSDLKVGIGVTNVQPTVVTHYMPDIIELTDYEPFGMHLPNRRFVSGGRYRFGFQGQEGDDEWNGEGNSIAFKYRVHDARIGRFLSIDPLAPQYPWNSPYAFSENIIINSVELEGLERVLMIYNSTYTNATIRVEDPNADFSVKHSYPDGRSDLLKDFLNPKMIDNNRRLNEMSMLCMSFEKGSSEIEVFTECFQGKYNASTGEEVEHIDEGVRTALEIKAELSGLRPTPKPRPVFRNPTTLEYGHDVNPWSPISGDLADPSTTNNFFTWMNQLARDIEISPVIGKIRISTALLPGNWADFDPLRDVSQRSMLNYSSFKAAENIQQYLDQRITRRINFDITNRVGSSGNGIRYGPDAKSIPSVKIDLLR